MSLSSLLLPASKGNGKKQNAIDNDLDALFRSSAVAFQKKPTPISIPSPGLEKKRKLVEKHTSHAEKSKTENERSTGKRMRISNEVEAQAKVLAGGSLTHVKGGKSGKNTQRVDAEVGKSTKAGKDKAKAGKDQTKATDHAKAGTEDMDVEDEDNADLENHYMDGKSSRIDAPDATEDSGSEASDTEGGPSNIVHVSVGAGKQGVQSCKHSGPQMRHTPADETPQQRNARTIFIGNLSVEVAQKRPLLKQLQRHILAQVPSAKIESTRFRSVPFQNPTSKLPTSDNEGGNATVKPPKPKHDTAKQTRPHDRDRTSSWRERQTDDGDDGGKSDEKKFLNDKQKKKIAFINQEFHSTADTVNAYAVFAHPIPVERRPSNLPPLPPIMDPYEAASLAVEKCDGTAFLERIIRVDSVAKGVQSGEKIREKDSAVGGDPKLSVFVGNLDFGSKEEDLRVFFEGIVSAERGPPSEDEGEVAAAVKKPKTWVTRVRIVRDKETQLGKGFAYIQFVDRQCVDEVLALEETKLKFAKRKLRVQRCKMLPGGSTSKPRPSETDALRPKSTAGSIPVVPKGDPSLGEKLAHLPKDARKEYKSSDVERVARRLAKKKARMALALAKGGVKTRVGDRDRVRKGPTSVNKGSGLRKESKSKGRVRSEKSLAKRNNKK